MTHRPIQPIEINGFVPGGTPRALPIFEWVDPGTLLVEERYQRDLSERSLKLIRKIVAGWDWSKFKAPIAVLTDAGLELVDGQCTSIAACTHPDITTIPVMIVEVAELGERAGAFIAHNRDRVAVTAMALHHAAVTAGDTEAQAVQRVCAAAGVTVLRMQPGAGRYQPGTTVAVNAIAALIRGRGEEAAIETMKILAQAGCAPIIATHIKAVDLLLGNEEYSTSITANQIVASIQALAPKIDHEVDLFCAAHPSTSKWKAMAILWFKNRRGPTKAATNITGNIPAPPAPANSIKKSVVSQSCATAQPDKPADLPTASGKLIENIALRTSISSTSSTGARRPPAPGSGGGKRDNRPPLSGWKPGPFLLRCSGCDDTYQGDKRSRSCADCAYGCEEAKSA